MILPGTDEVSDQKFQESQVSNFIIICGEIWIILHIISEYIHPSEDRISNQQVNIRVGPYFDKSVLVPVGSVGSELFFYNPVVKYLTSQGDIGSVSRKERYRERKNPQKE